MRSNDAAMADLFGRTETPRFDVDEAFEVIWALYPLRVGKKAARTHYAATVHTVREAKECLIALGRYEEHLKLNTWKSPQNGSTWFNNWRDWLTFTEPPGPNGPRRPVPTTDEDWSHIKER